MRGTKSIGLDVAIAIAADKDVLSITSFPRGLSLPLWTKAAYDHRGYAPLDAIPLGNHQCATVPIQANRVDQTIAHLDLLVGGAGPV